MSEELKPCPFCGGTASEKWAEGGAAINWYACDDCGAKGPWTRIGHDGSGMRNWNTRSDLALAAQGALLEKAAALLDQYEGAPCLPLDEGAWTDELTTFYNFGQKDATNAWKQQIRALSPDATAALAEREAKIRNDTLREALEKITSNYPKNADTDYDKGLDYGLTSAAVIIEALITTEGEG